MSLTALPVTDSDLTTLQSGVQFFTNTGEATAQAAVINTPGTTETVFTYAARLIQNNISLSQVAMAVSALMEGGTIAVGNTTTPNTLTLLSTQFLPGQVAVAIANGYNPTVFAAEALGKALASQATFNTNFVGLNVSQFAQAVATATGVNANAIQQFVANWQAFYTANPSALQGLTLTQASYGATFGDAVGIALLNPTSASLQTQVSTNPAFPFSPNTIQGLVANALIDSAEGKYEVGKVLGALSRHDVLQGEAGTPFGTFTLTIGVDSGAAFTADTKGAIFNAPPGTPPPNGVNNTLNAGDNFGSTFADDKGNPDATLNFTVAVSSAGLNPPLATNVTMFGVKTANISNTSGILAGFSGNVTGLTDVNVSGAGGVLLGTAAAGLNTALQNVSLKSSQAFTAWMTADALTGTNDAAAIALIGVTGRLPIPVTLNVTTGENGYERVTVASTGGPNSIALDTNAISLKEIDVIGGQKIHIEGTALNIANLHTFNGSATAGALDIVFNGAGNVAAAGGSGDDTFTFLGGFTSASKVDGDGGKNTLVTFTDSGAILGPDVGSKIINIQLIQHFTNNPATGDFAADMSQAGSAVELDLDGNYNGKSVSVSNLTDTMSVVYSGKGIDDLTLAHAGPVAGSINFTMAQTAPGGAQTVNTLHVAAGLATVNITSAGKAVNNIITKVSDVNDNVDISGFTYLNFGSAGSPYSFKSGIIDAHSATGGVQTWLAGDSTAGTPGAQTFIGGTGSDFIHELDFRADLVNIAAGGNDTVEFRASQPSPFILLSDTTQFNVVTGFSQADDAIAIFNNPAFATAVAPDAGSLFATNAAAAGAPIAAGTALNALHYVTGNALAVNGTTDNFNYIHIDTPVATAGSTVAAAFFDAMAGAGITVAAGHEYLMSLYDLQGQQAVFFALNSTANGVGANITQTDSAGAQVVALVGMSQADYDALGADNLKFV